MSITDELRDWFKDRLFMGNGYAELTAIADRIDAEALSRRNGAYNMGYNAGINMGFASVDDWLADHEDAIAERGWVKLPLDADGVPICVGDVMEFTYDPPQDQPMFEVSGFGANGTLFYAPRGEVFPRKSTKASVVRHHHEPTVEDVLRDFGVDIAHALDADPDATVPEAIIAEYAAKLRLAEEGE